MRRSEMRNVKCDVGTSPQAAVLDKETATVPRTGCGAKRRKLVLSCIHPSGVTPSGYETIRIGGETRCRYSPPARSAIGAAMTMLGWLKTQRTGICGSTVPSVEAKFGVVD